MSATTIRAMTVLAAAISVLQLPAATPGYSTLIAHRELGSIKAKQLKEKTIMSKALESLFAPRSDFRAIHHG